MNQYKCPKCGSEVFFQQNTEVNKVIILVDEDGNVTAEHTKSGVNYETLYQCTQCEEWVDP